MEDVLLNIENLSVAFQQYDHIFRKRKLEIINGLNLDLKQGEILVVFGASGSGKSLLAHAILGLLPDNALVEGTILYKNKLLSKEGLSNLLGQEISFIPQTINSFNPLMKISKQIHFSKGKKEGQLQALRQHLTSFGLGPEVLEAYPSELSGGMARKVLVSISIINQPQLIIADEPTPGMDDEGLNYIIDYVRQAKKSATSALIISHDIMTSLQFADRIAIFNQGQIVEIAPPDYFEGKGEKFKEQYSKDLWNALPENGFHLPIKV